MKDGLFIKAVLGNTDTSGLLQIGKYVQKGVQT